LPAQYPPRSRLYGWRPPELSRPVEKIVAYAPVSEISQGQRREFQEALLDADAYDDLPGKWQAAILRAERRRPKLRLLLNE
jgi:hypothetical protein